MANLQSKYMDEDEEEDEQSKTTTIAAVAITELVGSYTFVDLIGFLFEKSRSSWRKFGTCGFIRFPDLRNSIQSRLYGSPMRTNWLCERGAGIGPEQSGTGNRVGQRVSGNERLPGAIVLVRERLLRKLGDAGHCIYIGVVYLVMVTTLPNLGSRAG